MHLLIIGGTGFLGRYLAEEALDRDHTLSLFNRGLTAPELFREAEHLRGDRTRGLVALTGREFDAVIDTCAYVPRDVEGLADALAAAGHYTLVSSASVYTDPVASGTDESAPVATVAGPVPEEVTDETYGALKALCERAADALFPAETFVVRPGLIAGPRDPTDRFSYWPRRVAAGGRLLAARPAQPIQFIDVRDLVRWILDSAEAGRSGIYNAAGPANRLTMSELLEACRTVSGSEAEPVWVGDRFLRANAVEPWSELPLWLTARYEGLFELDCSRAISHGLRFRSLPETISDTLAWDASRTPDVRNERLNPEKEKRLLAAALPGKA